MSVLVVGSVAYDSVKTPAGSRADSLGGSAMYFAIATSCFTPVSIVAVVGDDFREEHVELLESHDVDVSGLERRPGKTFRWSGVYGAEDVNTRETLDTQLNVFADFSPSLTPAQRGSEYLFLANIDPELQLDVLSQMTRRPTLVALDTMNFWIDGKKDDLRRVVERVDVIFMDEGEARQFSGEANLSSAARRIHSMGPKTVLVKRGEHGVMMFNDGKVFVAPAFPLERVVDPTGAGDSFAGGFMGYLASTGDTSNEGFRRATVLGSVMGSFAVEGFSADRTSSLSKQEVEGRFRA
ncbi:MAG: PfkB family carbohydrate kinase, partial [Ardenticatenaceae bacterium]